MIRALLALAVAPTLAATVVFRIDDPRIDEASGIAPGIRSPGVVYVQNDSGDTNRFFAIDARTGATAATVTVPGATNVDWEDIAVATDAAGTPSVWLADIGDNHAERSEVRVYRVAEPRVEAGSRDRSITTARAEVFRLRYPDGPQDAESLAVAPGGDAYIFTKSPTGSSAVFRLPTDSGQLRRIGTLALGIGGLATGAALSQDGRTLAVRTYSAAYVWPVSGGDVAAAVRRVPTVVALPRQRQGEGIAIRGDRLLVDSEGVGQPVYSVALPAAASTSTTPGPSTASPSPSRRPGDEPGGTRNGVGLAILVLLVGGIVVLTRRRSRPR